MPRAFARPIREAAKLRDRRPDDIERDLKLERLDSGIEVGQEERARHGVLKGTGLLALISWRKRVGSALPVDDARVRKA
jgi:hypothetical protein